MTRKSSTEALIAAMRILARDIQSGDGVANAAIADKALTELERGSPRCECCGYLVHHREHLGCIRAAYKMAELHADHLRDTTKMAEQQARIAELEATITPELLSEKMLFELGEARKRVERAAAENPETGEVAELVRQRDSVIEQIIKSIEYSFRLGDLCREQGSRIAELEAQAAIGRRAVDVLKGLEWPVSRLTGEKYCPNCGQYAGHDSTCELAAILRDAEQAAPEPDTVAVDAVALEALRSAMSKLRAPMSRTEYGAARASIIEAAYRLLAGGE